MPEDSGKSSGIAVPGLVPSLADATEPSDEPPVVGPPGRLVAAPGGEREGAGQRGGDEPCAVPHDR